MTLQLLFYVIAIVLFILEALGVAPGHHLLEWAFASFVAGHIPFDSYITRKV